MFDTFETVIDTQWDEIVTIEHLIHTDSGAVLYILRDEEGAYYITDEHHLIKYDKYYFDREGHQMVKNDGMRTYTSGAVRDSSEGKGRMDLLPWNAIMEVSKHCQKGAEHYGEHNVDKGIPLSSLCDSGARHLAKFMDGWTDEDHLLAAAWNILWALQMREKKPEMIDIPWKEEFNKNI